MAEDGVGGLTSQFFALMGGITDDNADDRRASPDSSRTSPGSLRADRHRRLRPAALEARAA